MDIYTEALNHACPTYFTVPFIPIGQASGVWFQKRQLTNMRLSKLAGVAPARTAIQQRPAEDENHSFCCTGQYAERDVRMHAAGCQRLF